MSTKDVDELNDIASQQTELPRVSHKLTEVERFIRDANLKPGSTEVEAMRIYLLYWNGKDRNYLSVPLFFEEFRKHFERKMRPTFKVYMLDPAPFDLSKDGWWEYRKQLRRLRKTNERRRKEKKENKKR